jgi:uncharacterized RDD family membrane protein YckC
VSQLVTGEAVAVDLSAAKLASRGVAALVDGAVQLVSLFLLFYVAARSNWITDGAAAAAVAIVMLVGVFIGYPVAFETLTAGRTLGKMAMGLRVVRDDGGPVRFRHAMTRGLLWIVDVPMTLGSAAVITSLLSRRGKRLGDIVAGTFVLQERVPSRVAPAVAMPGPLADWARTLDLSRLPSGLALAVRNFLGRSADMSPAARDQLGRQLTAAVAEVVTPLPPAGTPGWAYLSAVVAERRRRDEERLRADAVARGAAGPSGWSAASPSPSWPSAAPPGPSPWSGGAPTDPGPPVVPPGPPPQPGPPPEPPPPPGPFTAPS